MLIDCNQACRLLFEGVVQSESAGILLRSRLWAVAQRLDFGELDREHMALVASELVSNLVKHAGGRGLIQVWKQPGPVLDILALDYGPGIADPEKALEDGYSTSHTLGKGLGSIQRLADAVHIYSRPAASCGSARRWSGAAILARFQPASTQPLPIFADFGLFVRALSGDRHNGDHVYLQAMGERLRVLHLDGLGHGAGAEQATAGLDRHLLAADDIEAAFRAVDQRLAKTRGAVGVLAEIGRRERRLNLLGVGDMQVCLAQGQEMERFAFPPGVLGKQHRSARPIELALEPNAVVITATDGIRRNWDEHSFPGLFNQHPQLIAYVLGNIMARISDDQSLCVVRVP